MKNKEKLIEYINTQIGIQVKKALHEEFEDLKRSTFKILVSDNKDLIKKLSTINFDVDKKTTKRLPINIYDVGDKRLYVYILKLEISPDKVITIHIKPGKYGAIMTKLGKDDNIWATITGAIDNLFYRKRK